MSIKLSTISLRKIATIIICLMLSYNGPSYASDANKARAAHLSGVLAEASIEDMLRSLDFTILSYTAWEENKDFYAEVKRLALKNAPYKSIYGHHARMEFMLIYRDRKILIQSKRLNVSGSVDEKLPYVYLNALHNLPDYQTILIHSGMGWRRGSLNWVKLKALETEGFYVLSQDEFIDWAIPEFR